MSLLPRRLLLLYLALAWGLALPACGQRRAPAGRRAASSSMQAYQTEQFKLAASPCAAKYYTMTIQSGSFVRSDGQTFPVPAGHSLDGDWGRSAISWGVGEEQQAVPERLDILYFSYTEDTFYEGSFSLPQQRMHALLKQGFWDLDEQRADTYHELTVCVLPKGVVVVWLSGAGRQVLVGRFQGQAVEADFRRFYPKSDRARMFKEEVAELPPAVQQQVKTHTINTRQWDEYLKTYQWQVAFNQPLTLYNYRVNYLSAEYTSRPDTRDLAPYLRALLTPQVRAVPSKLSLYVQDESKHHHLLRVKAFNEAETQAAFQTLHKASPSSPITLRVETDKYVKKATLALQAGEKTLLLTKSQVEVLSED